MNFRMRNVNRPGRGNRTGAMMPLVGIMMVVLLAFIALMIDTSWIALTKTEQQLAIDEAARTALVYLATDDSQATGVDRESEAIAFAQRLFRGEVIGGKQQSNVDVKIEFGQAVDVDGSRTFIPNVYPINAARGQSDATRGTLEPVKLFFSKALGTEYFRPKSTAIVASRPMDIALCIDCSGSMTRVINARTMPPGVPSDHAAPGSRWYDLLVALDVFLEGMRSENTLIRIGMVTFGGAGPLGTPKT